eukprot:CAMPEP_0168533912 /NCGR_PEP_ID=MMETSP0405-20121227/17470_1 /TAXON_ID=498012 /ORGANISM="Trichosphaerium sp, Strain Am-I-7 wt" /LENGTH=238 /DNA_ID=CAMNT_0008560285 /DNA_START=10 /DNA_END=726 /DNA_ORIENTATION=+
MTTKVCFICNRDIEPGTKYKTTNTQNFHRECFKCAQCSKQLEYEYCTSEGNFFCSVCYDNKFAPKCAKCNQPITEEHVQYRGTRFHNHCFSCLNCNRTLDIDNFFRVEERGPYCEPCADRLIAGGSGGNQPPPPREYAPDPVIAETTVTTADVESASDTSSENIIDEVTEKLGELETDFQADEDYGISADADFDVDAEFGVSANVGVSVGDGSSSDDELKEADAVNAELDDLLEDLDF